MLLYIHRKIPVARRYVLDTLTKRTFGPDGTLQVSPPNGVVAGPNPSGDR